MAAIDRHHDASAQSGSPTLPEVPIAETEGATIGRYKLLQVIGEGGFGIVYMAEQTEPVTRRVALKIIKLGMDTRQVIARFEAERQALAMMDHPNIAKVLDAGATDLGRPYFVMELVKGVPITKYCDDHKLSTEERLRLFLDVCHAIQHAHQKGIIHRDIKPSNILVTLHDGKPVPKVIDFGIAKATQTKLTDKTLFTRYEQIIGTPAYMSPEQAEMSGLDIDTRTDIYSLGVLLYELLTGTTPFDTQQLLSAGLDEMRRIIREQEPVRPSTRLSTLVGNDVRRFTSPSAPNGAESAAQEISADSRRRLQSENLIKLLRRDLDWIVLKCLEKDRTRRYETSEALKADLQSYLQNEPVRARPPNRIYRFSKTLQRHKIAFAGTVAVVGSLLVGGFSALWQAREARKAQQLAVTEATRARDAEQLARQESQRAEKERSIAEASFYAATINLVQQALSEGNLGRAHELLQGQRPKPGRPDLRGWEWRYLWGLCQSEELFTLTTRSNVVTGIAFSLDGGILATCDVADRHSGTLVLWDLVSRRQLGPPLTDQSAGTIAISPDGKLLAYGTTRNGVRVRQFGSEREIAALPGVQQEIWIDGLAFSPDSQILAAGDSKGDIALLNLVTAGTSLISGAHPEGSSATFGVSALAFHPSGRRLVSTGWESTTKLWDVAGGILLSVRTNDYWMRTAAFSPDGRILALGGDDNRVRLVHPETLADIRILAPHQGTVTRLEFSRSGRLLVTASYDQTIRVWDTSTWSPVRTLKGNRDEIWSIALSHDEKTVFSGSKDGRVRAWSTSPGDDDPHILRPAPDWSLFTLSANGSRLFALSTNRIYSVIELPNRRPIVERPFPGDPSKVVAAALAPSGNLLAYVDSPDALRVLHTSSGERSDPIPWHSQRTLQLTFSRDGRGLLAEGATNAVLWDVPSWQIIADLPRSASRLPSVVLAPDGRSGVTQISDGRLRTWNLSNPLSEREWAAHRSEITGVAFFPSPQLIATAGTDSRVKLWNVATGEEIVLGRASTAVYGICSDPDGKRLFAGSYERIIRVWDPSSGHQLLALQGHERPIAKLVFLDDGDTLITQGELAEGFRIWRAPSWTHIDATEQALFVRPSPARPTEPHP